ncbi:hypothetical protein BRARA_G02381 [Brassica rapa]|uniref:Uncharacterized protein n=1 Tax=Brassica campestris TaxID=3711 RepID=A0A397YP92_BRACM|nr:hypothetical protein BRARA_G02381 [Brassica rapa]CAG7903616.1 unnamed protein product [Brassica rapa]VDD00752.1 unnamed protein product [Brassica rapa]
MNSSRTLIVTRRSDPVKKNISSRRSLSSSPSFSSCSSSSLVFPGDSPLNSPITPLHLLGVPFSWEQLPGKPKDYSHRLNNHRGNRESSLILPLPPHRSTTFPVTGKNHKSNNSTKKNRFPVTEKDPFAAALLECSKGDDYDGNSSGSRKVLAKGSFSNRFGLVNLYGSCRRSCSVTESIVQLPGPEKAASYDHLLLPRRRR